MSGDQLSYREQADACCSLCRALPGLGPWCCRCGREMPGQRPQERPDEGSRFTDYPCPQCAAEMDAEPVGIATIRLRAAMTRITARGKQPTRSRTRKHCVVCHTPDVTHAETTFRPTVHIARTGAVTRGTEAHTVFCCENHTMIDNTRSKT